MDDQDLYPKFVTQSVHPPHNLTQFLDVSSASFVQLLVIPVKFLRAYASRSGKPSSSYVNPASDIAASLMGRVCVGCIPSESEDSAVAVVNSAMMSVAVWVLCKEMDDHMEEMKICVLVDMCVECAT
jgi:hypothetical protein